MKTDIARTFAALNATNEAILYAKSPEELYAKVCETAFSVGEFLAVAIFLLEPETNLLRFAAGWRRRPAPAQHRHFDRGRYAGGVRSLRAGLP